VDGDEGEGEEEGEETATWSETRPPERPVAPDAAGTPASEAEALRVAVIEAIGKSSPLLKTGLSSSLPWRVEEGRLVVPFRSGMEESVVRGSIADIAAKASQLAGRALKVELRIEGAPRTGGEESDEHGISADGGIDPVAIVERVFRGSRVAPK
jgi:hypothetical protein